MSLNFFVGLVCPLDFVNWLGLKKKVSEVNRERVLVAVAGNQQVVLQQ